MMQNASKMPWHSARRESLPDQRPLPVSIGQGAQNIGASTNDCRSAYEIVMLEEFGIPVRL